MPLYEEKLINPLAVRFSQDRIWPDFQDGRRVEDSLAEIATVPLEDGTYDLVLRPPFPPMEIIRLKQERRDAEGERQKDEKGRRLYGEESWFTFDNRRLYCLQRSALQLWPMVVAVVVKVLFDFPAVRCARHKFRTTSDGRSVKISRPDGQPGALWNWSEAAKTMQKKEGYGVADCVRPDTSKRNKDMLTDVPPLAQLAPGTRETTVAERFNIGTSGSSTSTGGQAAGQQLLSILKGSGDAGGGQPNALAALLGGGQQQQQPQQRQQQQQYDDGWGEQSWGEAAWGADDGWGAQGWTGRSSRPNSSYNRRR